MIPWSVSSEALDQMMERLEDADILLDVNTASNLLDISDDGKWASWSYEDQNRPETPQRFQGCPQVLSSQSFDSGRHFWDVDVAQTYSWKLGICYPSLERAGTPESAIGNNDKSWCLDKDGSEYSVRHAGNITQLPYHFFFDKIRIYLDYEAGQLSFYQLSEPIRHLHTFTATFIEPLHAVMSVWKGYIRISGYPTNVSEESDMENLWCTEEGLSEIAELQLDGNTASNLLDISDDQKTASRSYIHHNRPETPGRFHWPQVLSSQSFSSGKHIWEVSLHSRSWIVGMCYPSTDRTQWQSVIGNNLKSWCLASYGQQYSVIHNKHDRWLPGRISSNKVRIYLDYEAGEISFYELCDPTRHLHTFTATFMEPLHAVLCVWEGCVTTSGGQNMEEVQQTLDAMGVEGLLLDVDTAYNKLFISHDRNAAFWSYHLQNRPNCLKRFHHPQVLSCQTFSSRRLYWEVDVGASESWRVGMCYPSIGRSGWQEVIGNNHKSWCLVRLKDRYSVMHDGNETQLAMNISSNRFGIFLDYEAGQLSIYSMNEPIRHLHSFTATFTEPLHAAIWVWLGCIMIPWSASSEALEQMMERLEEADLLLDVNTASNLLDISDDGKWASWSYEDQNRPETPQRFQGCPQVLSSQSFDSGRHFWDVDVAQTYSWRLGMCYPSLERAGTPGSVVGNNDKSWCLDKDGSQHSVRHAGNVTQLPYHISGDTIRIYLDYEAGQLSFYQLSDPIRHLHTFTATFIEPLHAVMCVWEGYIRISGGGSVHVNDRLEDQ